MSAPSQTRLFFAYGTLRREAPMHALLTGARLLGPARFRGRLWDLGVYPGVTESRSQADRVQGELYELPQQGLAALLDSLDRYEGEGFERALREVATAEGECHTAWLYLFLGSTRGARRIASGDYVADAQRARPAPRRA